MTTSSVRKTSLLLAGLFAAAAGFAPALRAQDAQPAEGRTRFIYTLTVTDKLRVEIFQEGDLTTLGRVDASGNINLPLIGDIHLAGLTVDQAQAAVESAYVTKRFLRHPQVTISIDEYAPREVTIMGQVKNPSRYLLPLESTWSVVDLVSKAGGFTDTAKGSDVSITHYAPDGTKTVTKVDVDSIIKGKRSAKTIDNSQLLQPGDIVFVPESII
jgi:polysaccharide biosynthesis/export protein